MGVKIEGLDDVNRKLSKLPKEITDIMTKCVNDQAAELLRLTKKNSPVDTGTLRRSWSMEAARMYYGKVARSYVYTNLSYAPHVEYGHRVISHGEVAGYREGEYFFKRSQNQFEPVRDEIIKKYQAELSRRWKEL